VNGNSAQRFSFIKYLTNTDYRPNKVLHARWIEKLDEMGIQRGLNFFHDHFDEIIEKISSFPQFNSTKDKREKLREVRTFIDMYRERLFAKYLPIHNRTIMVIENTKFGTYMDTTLKTLIEAVRNFSGIDSEIKDFSVQQKENRASKLIENIEEFGQDYERTFIAGKPGLARKHAYASRCYYSFRAVINSLTEPHQHDEVHLPWAVAVTTYYLHLCGVMMRQHGFSYNEAADYLNYHTHVYSDLLNSIFLKMIEEAPYKGIPIVIGRNPSMYRTSIQRMFVTHVKTNPTINSISYPITSVVGPNADFDGDQMFCIQLLDNWTADELKYLAPHYGAWSLNGPRQVNENMAMPKPLVSSVISWLYDYPEYQREPDPDKFRQMMEKFSIREYNG
jgi:hypothetical protein